MKTIDKFEQLSVEHGFEFGQEYLSHERINAPKCPMGYRVSPNETFSCTRPEGHDGPHCCHGQDRWRDGNLVEFVEAAWPNRNNQKRILAPDGRLA